MSDNQAANSLPMLNCQFVFGLSVLRTAATFAEAPATAVNCSGVCDSYVQMTMNFDWSKLPDEVLQQVFENLGSTATQLKCVAPVCRRFAGLATTACKHIKASKITSLRRDVLSDWLSLHGWCLLSIAVSAVAPATGAAARPALALLANGEIGPVDAGPLLTHLACIPQLQRI